MKKILAAAVAFTVVSPAFAQEEGGIVLADYGTFSSYDECNSALAHIRNEQRKNPSTRGTGYQDLSGSAFNKASLTTTRCEEVSDDTYQIVFYEGGFDGSRDEYSGD
ncbi:MAG: hypothetical protein ACJ8EY_04485 [Sphingomicrobium sp.]